MSTSKGRPDGGFLAGGWLSPAARILVLSLVLLIYHVVPCASLDLVGQVRSWFGSGPAATTPPTADMETTQSALVNSRPPSFHILLHFNGKCCDPNDRVVVPAGSDLPALKKRAGHIFHEEITAGGSGNIDLTALNLYDEDGIINDLTKFLVRWPSAIKVGESGPSVWVVPPGALFVWPTVNAGHVFRPSNVESADPALPIELETLSESPRVFSVRNFLSDGEIKALQSFASSKLERSHVGIGTEVFSNDRTSKTAWDTRSEVSIRIQKRSFDLVRMPYIQSMADAVQIIKYQPGQTYIGHTDYFANGYPNTDPSKPDGTNRFVTIFAYLSDVEEGGYTVFPKSRSHPSNMTAKLVSDRLSQQKLEQAQREHEKMNGQTAVELNEDGTSKIADPTVDGGPECVGWRQTKGCQPDGERDSSEDMPCSAWIKYGRSGYCECENGRRVMAVTCEHSAFRCDNACAGRVSDGTIQTGSNFDLFVRECDSGDGLVVAPRRGDALLFYSQTPTAHLDPSSYHGGCPVIHGTKWAANVWIWNRKRPSFSNSGKKKTAGDGMAMTVLNSKMFPVDLYWIDYKGKPVHFHKIEPGSEYKVNTHVGHKWIVKRGNSVLKQFSAARGSDSAVVV